VAVAGVAVWHGSGWGGSVAWQWMGWQCGITVCCSGGSVAVVAVWHGSGSVLQWQCVAVAVGGSGCGSGCGSGDRWLVVAGGVATVAIYNIYVIGCVSDSFNSYLG
jgi:hypothetical protein